MLKNKKILLLVSLLIAIGAWIYVVGTVDPQISATIYDVPVTMSGQDYLEDHSLHATLKGPETINVTISGKRSYVTKVKKKGLTATVDVSHCNYGKNKKLIAVGLPTGVTGISIDKLSKEEATFVVE